MENDSESPRRDIVVIGASAGGVSSLQALVSELPEEFPAAIFVVLHLPESANSFLPEILSRAGPLSASHAVNGAKILPGRIYVAPPGFHLTLEPRQMRVTRGARENGNRPAVDPLFRSAAVNFGRRVIGIVLSGSLDDGTVGLKEIKAAGGLAIVQDPADTPWPSMPQNAIDHVAVDFVGHPAQIGMRLIRDVCVEVPMPGGTDHSESLMRRELEELTMHESERDKPGFPSPYSCPECGGVLWELRDGELLRFRCRVGHAYTSDNLVAEQEAAAETALWTALRALEEQAALRRRLADRARRLGRHASAAQLDKRGRELEEQAQSVRELVLGGVGQFTAEPVK